MNDEDDLRAWTLHKLDGADRLCLGPLRSGMTRAEVAVAAAAAYGPVERTDDHATYSGSMAAAFQDLAKFGVAAEDIAATQAAWDGVANEIADLVTEVRSLNAPILDYAGGRLSRVATDHHCKRLTLMGRPVYEGDSRALLAALETMDAGAVLRQGDTVWFPRLGVTVMGFYGDREDDTVGLLDDPNDPRIRHVILEAYKPVSDAPSPTPITFLCSDENGKPGQDTAFRSSHPI